MPVIYSEVSMTRLHEALKTFKKYSVGGLTTGVTHVCLTRSNLEYFLRDRSHLLFVHVTLQCCGSGCMIYLVKSLIQIRLRRFFDIFLICYAISVRYNIIYALKPTNFPFSLRLLNPPFHTAKCHSGATLVCKRPYKQYVFTYFHQRRAVVLCVSNHWRLLCMSTQTVARFFVFKQE